MTDKTLRNILLGSHEKLEKPTTRSQTINWPAATNEEKSYSYKYRKDDGLLSVFVKKIDELEQKIGVLEREMRVVNHTLEKSAVEKKPIK